MKVYDITQELLSAEIYPGDPSPKITTLASMKSGALYNLYSLDTCLHVGTHIDAPRHFIRDGKTVEELEADIFVGRAYVAEPALLSRIEAAEILAAAKSLSAAERILIKGDAVVTLEAAELFAAGGVRLIGVESQSVGSIDAPAAVHIALLSRGVALLEGLRLKEISTGAYTLVAPPLKVAGAEGAPCRALLIEE